EPLDLGALDPEHDVERSRQHAVAERGDSDIADLFARHAHVSIAYEAGTIWISSLSWSAPSGAGRNLNWTASFMLSARPEIVAVCRLSFGMNSLSMSRTAGSDSPEKAR